MPMVNSFIVEPGYRYNIGNETYQTNAPMNFERVIYTDTFIIFNNTGWNITSPSNILITLRHINDSTINEVANSELIEFEVYLVSGSTAINISGFRENIIYNIYRDSVFDSSFLSNNTRCIDINVDSGVSYIYTIYQGGNTAPTITNPSPSDTATGVTLSPTLSANISDADGNLMDWYIRTNDNGGTWETLASNTGVGNSSISTATTTHFINHSTVCTWSVNVSDSTTWTNQTFTFTTLSNTAPTITNPSPSDGATGVSVGLSSLSVTIEDSENTFNWTITTSPNIGTNSANGASNGSKTCTIAGLSYDGYYTWTVSVTDGTSWTNTTYDFTVESDPGTGPPPNSAPTASNPYPTDESTLIPLTPICHVLVADANLDLIDVNFYWRNETDVYVKMQTNSSVSSGNTVYWNYTNASSYDTNYYWRVTVDDGTDNITYTYNFTTWTNIPQVNWTIPSDGTIDISVEGTTITANIFDYQGDNMNVSIWSNYTGSWVQYAGFSFVPGNWYNYFFLDHDDDGDWDISDVTTYTGGSGWQGNGNYGILGNVNVTNRWGMESYGETYFISINISDNSTERAWNNYTFSFTTELNTDPVISDPIPRNGVRWISIYTTNLSVVISDANSLFNYTIETNPDIGSSGNNSESDGVKGCAVSGLNYSTTYTWYVNATDGEAWTNETYTFTTKGVSDFDFPDFMNNLPEFAVGPFKVYVNDFVWVFIFVGMIGLVWGASKNVGSTLIATLLVFAAYGGKRAFVDGMGQQVSLMFSVIAAICLAVLILGLFLKKRHG